MDEICWKLDESNDIRFKISINSSGPLSDKPKIRLVCEGKDMSFCFPGILNSLNEVEVTIPPMKGKILEGKYHTKLETILDDKYFVPLQFDAIFEISTSVMAEIVNKKEDIVIPNKVEASIIKQNYIVHENTPKKQKTTTHQQKKVKETNSKPIKIKSLKDRFQTYKG